MQVKTCPAQIKAAGTHEGTEEGVFEAIVAAYNVDSVNDRIIPGAFKASLDQWKASGRPIPVIWSHKSDDPDYHIGYVEEAEERETGLWVRGRVDLDAPKAAQVYRLLKGRRVGNFSFAYDIDDARPGKKDDGTDVQELHRLTLHEVGPCLIGANRATSLLDVKHDQSSVTVNVGDKPGRVTISPDGDVRLYPAAEQAAKISDTAADLKAGRVLSKQNEDRVAEIARLASELLASVKAEAATGDGESVVESNAEKAAPTEPAAAPDSQAAPEAATEVKSDEPVVSGVADERLRTEVDLLMGHLDLHTL
jgi:HK97 family phage prohead protease